MQMNFFISVGKTPRQWIHDNPAKFYSVCILGTLTLLAIVIIPVIVPIITTYVRPGPVQPDLGASGMAATDQLL